MPSAGSPVGAVESIDAAGLRALAGSVAGSVVLRGDPEFPPLRKPFLGQLREPVPLAVVRCADPADVAEAVAFARSRELPFAVRSGGHSLADFSSTDGLLIDLGPMDSVQLDGEVVTVGPGVRIGPLAEQLVGHRRVLPCGWHPAVAVGGAVLGGGYGVLSRYHGLGCDHLRAAQVVLSDGRTVWVDEEREPELFWALRGAGWGGFGVVTALVLRTFPAPRLTTFVHHVPWRLAAKVVDAWQRWAPAAPELLNAELALQSGADRQADPQVVLFGAVVGSPADARPLLEDFLNRVDPDGDLDELTELSARAGAIRHTYAGQPMLDRLAPPPPGVRPWLWRVKSEFFDQPMPAEAIEALVTTFVADPVPGQVRELLLVPWRGAYQRVAPEATAFVHRTPMFLIGHHGLVLHQATDQDRAAVADWVGRSWQAVHPWASGRAYPNYPDPDLPDWARAYYGDNLPRLRRVRARYDPEDVFRFAQSVPVSGH